MDSVTHIALGACMGYAFAGKPLAKKAMLWGAVAQSIPDIDFIASFWMDPASSLLAHRGLTHSFLFCIIAAFVLALSADRWHRPHNISFGRWFSFFAAVIFVHIFIDAFNNYGVGWFEPFSNKRISFNSIYVADPFFSIAPILSCILILLKRGHASKKKIVVAGMFISGLYLGYCLFNKWRIDSDVRSILNQQKISYTRYFTTPAPLQNWLWFVVAGNDSGYHVGFRSLFDSQKHIDFRFFARNDSLPHELHLNEPVAKLVRFSKGFYTIEKRHDTLVFNDLRFGQIVGWHDQQQGFVFQFYLQENADNTLVVQRGRFKNWDKETFLSLLKKIRGN